MQTILFIMDCLGTTAFAVAGALVGVRKRMDLFGVLVMAIVSSTGGGVIRDLMIGNLPPTSFLAPRFVTIAAVTGSAVFLFLYLHPHMPQRVADAYDHILFCFDTLGVAAFTVDGIVVGINHGYRENLFLLVFLGVVTGVGGGVIRDLLANRMPDILKKHIYAIASIVGGLVISAAFCVGISDQISLIAGFVTIVILRVLAARLRWNLPKIDSPGDSAHHIKNESQ